MILENNLFVRIICDTLGIHWTPEKEIIAEIENLVSNKKWLEKMFNEVVCPVSWDLVSAGYRPATWRWTDTTESVKKLIADKEQLEAEVSRLKKKVNLAEEEVDA